MRFHSILFDRPAGSVDGDEPNEPAFFGDLNLDQVLEGNRVRVSSYDGQPDYSAEVEATFAKFKALRQAVPRLIEVIQQSHDPYLAAEAVTALARIGDPAGLTVVDRIAREGPAVPIAASTGAAVEVDPAFTDRDVGGWSGTATAEVIRRFGALSVPPEPAARLPTGCWSRLEVCDGRWSAAVVGEVPGDGSRPGQHHMGHR